ncbi:MAG: aminotransferase class IV [Patescibacteria group bacterium]
MQGIYETFRSFSGVYALLPEHQKRLERSCGALGVEVPKLRDLLLKQFQPDLRVRVDVEASGEVKLKMEQISAWDGSFLWHEKWKLKPVHLVRKEPEFKSTDIAAQQEARAEAAKEGFQEVLLVNEKGEVMEGGISNVFLESNGGVITPGEGVLPGIGRELILKAAEELGVKVEFRPLLVSELQGLNESLPLFLSNSIRGMVATGPVTPLMREISDWCSSFLQKRIDAERGEVRGDS